MANEQIIPDSSGSSDIKLRFDNLFAFLSSLDYLVFLEKEGVFDHMDTEYLYYTEEKAHVWLFTFKEYLKWVSLTYLTVSLTCSIILGLDFITATTLSAIVYGIGSVIIVNRYLWGRGYLYRVLRDFLWASFFISLFLWLGLELLAFYTIPFLWYKFEQWLFGTPPQSTIEQLIYPGAYYTYSVIKQVVKNMKVVGDLIHAFFLTLPIKVFAFMIPIAYFYYIRRFRRSSIDYYMQKITKVPD